MCSSVAFSIFTVLYELYHPPSPQFSSSSKTKPLYSWNTDSPGPLSLSPDNHSSTFCLYQFHSSRISYKWNQTILVLLWLAYFTQYNVISVYLCYRICRISFLFRLNFIPFVRICYILLLHSTASEHLGSTPWLPWIVLLGTWVYKYLFQLRLSVLLGMYLEVELPGQ